MTHTIEEIKGLDPATRAKMTELGITTVEQVIDQAATPSKHTALAQELGVSSSQLTEWVAEAAVLAKSVPPAEPSAASHAQQVGGSIQEDLSSVVEAGTEQGTGTSMQDYAQNLQKQAAELLGRAPEPVQQFAQDAQAKAQELSKEGQVRLQDAAQQASSGIDQAARTTGGTLRGAADSVRSYAPESGAAADVANRFASGLEYTGSYLEEQSERGIVANMADWVRRHPLPVALAGGGLLLLFLRGRRRR